ncbi:FMN-binding protein [bacterium]|nr:FMN-binding protein [bacterium]
MSDATHGTAPDGATAANGADHGAELAVVTPSPRESARLVLTLAVAGLFSGLAIVGAYVGTLGRIQENQARALREAVFQVVPGSSRLQGLAASGDALVPAESGGGEGGTAAQLYAAYDDAGAFRGYAIPAEGSGFQDTIALIFGFDPAKRVIVGMQVLESRETPGLGDKIAKDPAFAVNFQALDVAPEIHLVKNGAKTNANEVDGITGATISSKAIVRILNDAASAWMPRLPSPGEEPPLPDADAAGSGTHAAAGAGAPPEREA